MSEHEARVLKVDTILPHSNADALEIVKIWDYNCVVKKGQFNLGDLVVFLEPDTNVPLDREEFSFLKNPDKPERTSHRLTVKKLRGVPSQGLLIAAPRGFKEGDDTWQHFGLTRWEPGAEGHTGGPKGGGSLGSSHAEKGPEFKVPHYDLENARKYFKLIEPNEEVLLTNKIHGSQFKATYSGGRMYAGSRNMWKKEPGYYFHEKPKTTFLKLVLKIVKYISGGNAETVFNYCIKSKHKFIRILNQHLTYQVGENAWWTALRQNDWIESWCNKNPNAVLYGEVYGCFYYKTPITLSD
jgi:RNA ligase (TIGR02306 family)